MTGKSIAFSSRRGCHRKRSKPERSGWRDAFTLLARSLAGSQTRAPASGGIFPGIWATCWRTFRTLGRRGIRVSNCRRCGWETTASIVSIDDSEIRTGTAHIASRPNRKLRGNALAGSLRVWPGAFTCGATSPRWFTSARRRVIRATESAIFGVAVLRKATGKITSCFGESTYYAAKLSESRSPCRVRSAAPRLAGRVSAPV